MSTSNTKVPGIIRGGFIENWNQNRDIRNMIQWELNNSACLVVWQRCCSHSVVTYFYKLIQKSFISKVCSRKLKYLKDRRLNGMVGQQHHGRVNSKLTKFKVFDNLVDLQFQLISTYKLTTLKKFIIANSIREWTLGEYTFDIENICKKLLLGQIMVSKKFNELLRTAGFAKNLKHGLDMTLVYSMMEWGYADLASLTFLINRALERNSKKGQQRRILLHLFNEINKVRTGTSVSNSIMIKVTGKFSTTGRTQSMVIMNKKIPLHSILHICHYAETESLTKAGVFSIKIWYLSKG